jgi:hypothetical protein
MTTLTDERERGDRRDPIRRRTLLRIPDHHPDEWPAPRITIKANAYVGYFQNAHGEQIVFHFEPQWGHGMLYHGDMEWEPLQVRGGRVINPAGQDATRAVLDDTEAAWLQACWDATKILRSYHERHKHDVPPPAAGPEIIAE